MKKQKLKLCTYEKLFFLLLVFIPIIPYSKVLTEEINSGVFLLLSLIFILFSIKKSFNYKMNYFVLFFFLLCFISVLISMDKIITYMDSFYLLSGIMAYLIVKKSNIDKNLFFLAIFVGSSLSSIIGIMRYLTYSDARLDGLFNYANSSALLFAISIIIYYMVLKDYTWKQNDGTKYFLRINLLFLMCGMFLTQSRGGIAIYVLGIILTILFQRTERFEVPVDMIASNFIALLFSYLILNRQFLIIFLVFPLMIFYVFFKFKKKSSEKLYKYILSALTFVGIVGIIYKGFSRVEDISINNPQLQERFVFYQDAVRLIFHNWFGIGAANYSAFQYLYQSANYSIKYAHNGFLQIAIDFGIITLLLFLAFIIYKLVQAYRAKKLINVATILISMILIHSLMDFSLSFVYIDIILFICLGFITPVSIKSTESITTKKVNKAFSAFLILLNLFILIILPGEVIYNIATNLADLDNVNGAYSILKLWNGAPYKTGRYYEKSAIWAFKIYSDHGDKSYLRNVIADMNSAVAIDKEDPRLLETEGMICFFLKDYKQATSFYYRSKDMREFYLPTYEELKKSYRSSYDNNELTEKELNTRIDNLDIKINGLKLKLNPKAKFMQDQP